MLLRYSSKLCCYPIEDIIVSNLKEIVASLVKFLDVCTRIRLLIDLRKAFTVM